MLHGALCISSEKGVNTICYYVELHKALLALSRLYSDFSNAKKNRT